MTNEEERSAVERGRDKYRARWRAAQESGHETDTDVGRALLKATTDKLKGELEPWLDRARTSPGRRHSALDVFGLIKDIDLLCLLILRSALDGISKPRSFTNLALKVGTAIEQEHRLREAARRFPMLVAAIKEAQFGGRSEERRGKWIMRICAKIEGRGGGAGDAKDINRVG
mgnify:CR=1 FL=1